MDWFLYDRDLCHERVKEEENILLEERIREIQRYRLAEQPFADVFHNSCS